jgi:hypothetical protein
MHGQAGEEAHGRRAIDLAEAMSPEEFVAAIRAARKRGNGRPNE